MRLIPERLRKHGNFSEVVGIALLLVALLSCGAILSYDSTDPVYLFKAEVGSPGSSNWVGRVGATMAEALLQTLGTVAFLFPIGIAVLGWRRVKQKAEEDSGGATLLGYAGLAVVLCTLLDLLFGSIHFRDQIFPAGGIVGHLTGGGLVHLFNLSGALLVTVALLTVLVVLVSRFSFVRSVEWLMHRLRSGGRELWGALTQMLSDYRARASTPSVERAEIPAAPRRPSIPLPLSAETDPTEPLAAADRAAAAAPLSRPKRKIQPAAAKQARLPMDPPQRGYRLPPLELLNDTRPQVMESEQTLLERARQITSKLQEFSLQGQVVAIHPGPVVTTFEFKPEAGVKYSKITSMNDDLSLALRAESVRISRMPGRSTVGIEVPNQRQETIYPRELMASEAFRNSQSMLTLALGKDIGGEVFTADLDRMPHLLIAGATGAGKSVGINCMIVSILYKATPEQVRFIMIDTKMIELGVYADIPHLLIPVVTEVKYASSALKWAVREMEQRYRRLAAVGVRNIAQFNSLLEKEPHRTMDDPQGGDPIPLAPHPLIVIVIDELADLMLQASADVEESIMRLAQMARAVGIHLIIATQRPSVDVITGTIKANFPARIAYRVSQRVDSRTIIDQQGAEHLLGRGDMLFLPPSASRVRRLHGGFITEVELHRVTSYIRKMADPVYDESILRDADEPSVAFENGERDEMYGRAVRTVIEEGKCSITLLQRRLQLGYARAARIVDMMEREGVVSAGQGSKPREILVGAEFIEQLEAR